MAISDLRKFFFYQEYVWDPEDFENFETWLWGGIEASLEGAFGSAVLKGLRPRAGGGMNLLVDAGIAGNASGRIVVVASQLNIAVPSPVGNPARSYAILRPKSTNATFIPEPLNPSNSVPLHEKLEYDLLILSGTPAATPVYPAKLAGDIVVAGIKLNAGHTVITEADLDWGVVDRPRKHKHKINKVTAAGSIAVSDEITEADFSAASGILALPLPGECEGEKFTVVKVDATDNVCSVSGDISGVANVDLDTQWQSITVYSNGISFRSI